MDVTRGDVEDCPRFVTTVLDTDEAGPKYGAYNNVVIPLPFARMRGRFAITQIEKIEVTAFYLRRTHDPSEIWAPIEPGKQGYHFAFHHIPRAWLELAVTSPDAFFIRHHQFYEYHSGTDQGYMGEGPMYTDVMDMPGAGYLVPDDHILFSIEWLLYNTYNANHLAFIIKTWFKRTSVNTMQYERLSGGVMSV